MKRVIKVNEDPRITVNPLCEYVDNASPARRFSIIKQSKKPLPYVTRWYNQADELLSFYLSAIKDDPKVLRTEIGRLVTRNYGTDTERKYANASAEALSSFLTNESRSRKEFEAFTLEMAVHNPKHKFMIEGVKVSLRPELLIRDSAGKEQLGFVKFYFCKSEPLEEERAFLMACLVRYYFEQEYGFNFKNEHCFVLDVYTGALYNHPTAYKKRLSDIKAACKEIADRWGKVTV